MLITLSLESSPRVFPFQPSLSKLTKAGFHRLSSNTIQHRFPWQFANKQKHANLHSFPTKPEWFPTTPNPCFRGFQTKKARRSPSDFAAKPPRERLIESPPPRPACFPKRISQGPSSAWHRTEANEAAPFGRERSLTGLTCRIYGQWWGGPFLCEVCARFLSTGDSPLVNLVDFF